ncbi:MAG: leucine-rich repeat domain-containing protein [Candidatus Methanoplasma sp.]|nr:leucine-rich repeat domain-containing protein [Candidatus Methanoplasma sp.]
MGSDYDDEYVSYNSSAKILTIKKQDGFNTPNPTEYWSNLGVEHLVLSPGVLSTPASAFFGFKELKTVALPPSLKSIGDSTFQGCTSLTYLTLPASLKNLGDSAFFGCTSLTSVTFSSDLTYLGHYAFYGCKALTTVTLPSSLTSIGDGAFRSCTGLKTVILPSGLESIGESVFWGCTSLMDLQFPLGLVSIGYEAFRGCVNIKTIDLPSGITYLGSGAFQDCPNLMSVTLPSNLGEIRDHTFSGCTGLTALTIHPNTKFIGEDAFGFCRNLKSLTFLGLEAPSVKKSAFQTISLNGFLYYPLKGMNYETSIYLPNGWTYRVSGSPTSVHLEIIVNPNGNVQCGANTYYGESTNIEAVEESSSRTLTFLPSFGYQVSHIIVDGHAIPETYETYTFANVYSSHSVSVSFEKILDAKYYDLAIFVGPNGRIVINNIAYADGTYAFSFAENTYTPDVTFLPNAGYRILSVVDNGYDHGPISHFGYLVNKDHSLSIRFESIQPDTNDSDDDFGDVNNESNFTSVLIVATIIILIIVGVCWIFLRPKIK